MIENVIIRNMEENDKEKMLLIFNYFVRESYAAYCDFELNIQMFNKIFDQTKVVLIAETEEQIIGNGFVSKYNPFPNFCKTGVLTYFILPEYTGKGIGSMILNKLIKKGQEMGINNYLANISSHNSQSINFHLKHGFKQVGKFESIGSKFGKSVDIIWMQKIINENEEIK